MFNRIHQCNTLKDKKKQKFHYILFYGRFVSILLEQSLRIAEKYITHQ